VVVTNTRVRIAEPLSHLHYTFVSFHDTRRSLRTSPKESTIRKPKSHIQNAAVATTLSANLRIKKKHTHRAIDSPWRSYELWHLKTHPGTTLKSCQRKHPL